MRDIKAYWDEMARFGPEASVMDPLDKRGHKNRYISVLRDRAILNALSGFPAKAKILDFGCGSGNLSKTLADNNYKPVGVDISLNLLSETKRHGLAQSAFFIQNDGMRLPFRSETFDACVTHWVFIYLTDTKQFCGVLEEIFRVLKPGGKLIAVEQTCLRSTFKPKEMKLQRSMQEMLQLFAKSGFQIKENRTFRKGHFPLIYFIRYGLIPYSLFSRIGEIEELLGRVFREAYFDYADTMFIVEKRAI